MLRQCCSDDSVGTEETYRSIFCTLEGARSTAVLDRRIRRGRANRHVLAGWGTADGAMRRADAVKKVPRPLRRPDIEFDAPRSLGWRGLMCDRLLVLRHARGIARCNGVDRVRELFAALTREVIIKTQQRVAASERHRA